MSSKLKKEESQKNKHVYKLIVTKHYKYRPCKETRTGPTRADEHASKNSLEE